MRTGVLLLRWQVILSRCAAPASTSEVSQRFARECQRRQRAGRRRKRQPICAAARVELGRETRPLFPRSRRRSIGHFMTSAWPSFLGIWVIAFWAASFAFPARAAAAEKSTRESAASAIRTLQDAGKCDIALQTLLEIGDPAVPLLREALNDKDQHVRISAAKALAALGFYSDALPTLTQSLSATDGATRHRAAVALADIGPPANVALSDLESALSDPAPRVRAAAAWALGRIGKAAAPAIPALSNVLGDRPNQEENVRNAAAWALGEIGIGVPTAATALAEALTNDSAARLRLTAANALGNVGAAASEVVPALLEGLRDSSTDVRDAVVWALGRIAPRDTAMARVIAKGLRDPEQRVRQATAWSLGHLGPAVGAVVPELTAVLDTSTEAAAVREVAAWALGIAGPDAQAATPSLMRALTDPEVRVRKVAADSLANIGPASAHAVPALTTALIDAANPTDVRQAAAWALGRIGPPAATTLPSLADLLDASDQPDQVLQATARAIEHIAAATADDRREIPTHQLRAIVAALKRSVQVLPTAFHPQSPSLAQSIDQLQAEVRNRYAIDVLFSPWLLVPATYVLLLLVLWTVLYCFQPLWLLRIEQVLRPYVELKLPGYLGGVKIELAPFLLIRPFSHRTRVLDKWVQAHIEAARTNFQKQRLVLERSVHVDLPVRHDGRVISSLSRDSLRRIFGHRRATLLIWGEGGSGKTSLACRIALWATSDVPAERICGHQMVPLLIERELESTDGGPDAISFRSVVKGMLQSLLELQDPIEDDLLERLLRRRRVLVLIDNLSGMSEKTRMAINPKLADFPVNALVVTSRVEEDLGPNRTTVKPLPMDAERLSHFMHEYLVHQGVRSAFDDEAFFRSCGRLSAMVQKKQFVVLLAKLYADQLIVARKEPIRSPPDNIADLMLNFLNELNRGVAMGRRDYRAVRRDVGAVAWACLEQTLQMSSADKDYGRRVLRRLDERNVNERLEYLEDRLHLIETIKPLLDRVRFRFDPVGEYLAGLHLLEESRGDERAWQPVLDQIRPKVGDRSPLPAFVLALLDCCRAKGSDYGVPDSVLRWLEELVQLRERAEAA